MKLNLVFAIAISSFFVSTTAFGFSDQAKALTFSGISTGTWGQPTPGSTDTNPTYTGVGSNTFTWGDPNVCSSGSSTPGGCKITGSNKLTLNGNSFLAEINSVFKIADLTYFNGTVLNGTIVEFVPLNLNVSFNSATGNSKVFDFKLRLLNTPNDAIDPEKNADFVFIDTNFSNGNFTFEGNKYTFELTGFNSNITQISIKALEGGTTKTGIYAKIKPIPEPSLMTGIYMLGIYITSRKKLKKKC
ncbi:MAG: choice-of-anchor K domain-containing protein [Nostoc sp. DedVER02]|uniref:choice-of-anchor K domain-containing protein n=1 Tax=unclassified Nostoc TaxID=2593658 RepID=UPI002AD56023|nr:MULTISPECIES: choice-of-anchor K domain-containing protein [unclassified Nostoc]MDZ7989102.1 choice-of-anchor K domain-containing protein [Nostoc sp. DedVER02]MDZ8113816.1 choice-of-anchor K domain-containing protein [Nostoc sp. DedVER01b]